MNSTENNLLRQFLSEEKTLAFLSFLLLAMIPSVRWYHSQTFHHKATVPEVVSILPLRGPTTGGTRVFVTTSKRQQFKGLQCVFGQTSVKAQWDGVIGRHFCDAPPHPRPHSLAFGLRTPHQQLPRRWKFRYHTPGYSDVPLFVLKAKRFQEQVRNVASRLPSGVGLGAVLKSSEPVPDFAHLAARATKVTMFFVDRLESAIQMRKRGVQGRIMVLYLVSAEKVPLLVHYKLEVQALSLAWVKRAQTLLRGSRGTLKTHLWLDTGMGREGVLPTQALPLAKAIENSPNLSLAGIATHFGSLQQSDQKALKSLDRRSHTVRQYLRFRKVLKQLRKAGLGKNAIVHAGSSSALRYKLKPLYFDMLRVGTILFDNEDLKKPNYRWETTISQIKVLPKGWCIDYSCDNRLKKATRVGVLAHIHTQDVEYFVKGIEVPPLLHHHTVITLDLSKVPTAKVGDKVQLRYEDELESLENGVDIPITVDGSGKTF